MRFCIAFGAGFRIFVFYSAVFTVSQTVRFTVIGIFWRGFTFKCGVALFREFAVCSLQEFARLSFVVIIAL